MPFPVELLTTPAECDTVLTALNQERRVFTVRDQVLDLQADQSADRATDRNQDLAAATASVTRLTPLVAGLTPGSAEHATLDRLLTRAQRRVEDLSTPAASAARTPTAAFLKAVDVRQVAVQVLELEAAIAEVTARRAAL
ncbi:hypothetical protein [Hymenobacter koreensis]